MKIVLVGPSYVERSLPFDAQRTINFYPVFDQQGKEVSALYGTPGLDEEYSINSDPVRAMFNAGGGRVFAVVGSGLYEIFSDGTSTLRGSLNQNTGNVVMDENGLQLIIADGVSLYVLTYSTNVFAKVVSGQPDVGTACFIGGYFIANKLNSGSFYVSNLYDGTTWGVNNFATAESNPDNLLRVINALGQLWLLGKTTSEIWSISGTSAVPFERANVSIEVGILSPYTAITIDRALYWVGRDKRGVGAVYRASGFTPEKISTEPIDRIIQAMTQPELMNSWSYQQDGHTFFVITGGDLETSLTYDITTGLWHERAYFNNGSFEQHLGSCAAFAFNKTLVGDRNTGIIYDMSFDYFDDNGTPLVAERTYTHLSDEGRRIRFNALEIGMEVGVGNQNGEGVDPQVMMQLSKDGGRSYTQWFSKSYGAVGQYQKKVEFRRLGVAEQMTFRIRISDPVKRNICGSYLR